MISEERLQQLFVQEQERFAVEKLLGPERAAIRFARAVEREARRDALRTLLAEALPNVIGAETQRDLERRFAAIAGGNCYHNKPQDICSFCAEDPGPWTR